MNNPPLIYPMKTLEEMQRDSKIRNDAEADRICKKCKLCIGWCCVFWLFIWCISLLITTIRFNNVENQIIIIEEYLIDSSGSN